MRNHRRCWRGSFPDSMTRGSIWLQAARRPLAWLRPPNSIFLDHYATSLADICAILLRVCWARHGGNAKDRGDPGCGHCRLQPACRRRRGAHTRAPPGPAQRSDRPHHHRAIAGASSSAPATLEEVASPAGRRLIPTKGQLARTCIMSGFSNSEPLRFNGQLRGRSPQQGGWRAGPLLAEQ